MMAVWNRRCQKAAAESSRRKPQTRRSENILEMVYIFTFSKPTPSDIPPASPYVLSFPKQGHQLKTKYSNARDCGTFIIQTIVVGELQDFAFW